MRASEILHLKGADVNESEDASMVLITFRNTKTRRSLFTSHDPYVIAGRAPILTRPQLASPQNTRSFMRGGAHAATGYVKILFGPRSMHSSCPVIGFHAQCGAGPQTVLLIRYASAVRQRLGRQVSR
jgi:hypothetical protein